ncbi:MAG: glycosyltransferase [Oscillospiraceae bacterium]|nr:glycosyltransferase [Oscillospiraceae bacterium]
MKKEKLISIIVPIYNTEKYLKKCLDSIINQTYQNLEIILINDGSTDKSYEICKKYKNKDDRIILINKKNNTGQSDARNRGLNIAKGDFIGFVDSDDIIHKDMFKILLNNINNYNCEISMCNILEVEDTPNVKIDVKVSKVSKSIKIDRKTALNELLLDRECFRNYPAVKLFKRELFNDIRFPKGRLYEDIRIIYKLFERANNLVYVNDYMYYYIQRKDSVVNNVTEESILEYIDVIFERYYYIKEKYPDLQLNNVYSIVNVVIKMSRWAIRGNFLDLYNGKLKEYHNVLKKELISVDEGELIKLMTNFEKMSLYMLEIDRDIYINVIKSLMVKK